MAEFSMKIAGHTARVSSLFESTPQYFRFYLTDDTPEFSISVTRENIAFEQADLLEEAHRDGFKPRVFTDPFLERAAIQRAFAEYLFDHSILLFHGSAIAVDGKGYLFTAPSGTGKSTHIRLWRKHLGKKVGIVNGDKPFVSLDGEIPHIYGTPWAGKEGWQRNCRASLSGICIVQRGETNSIRKIDASEALPILFKQIYLPKEAKSLDQTLALMDVLLKKVPIYLLQCDISEEAVQCSFEALTGLPYRP